MAEDDAGSVVKKSTNSKALQISQTEERPPIKQELKPPPPPPPASSVIGKQMAKCKSLLKELRTSTKHIIYASIFYNPVNPEADGCLDYFDHIKKPMDLSTIQQNMDKGLYQTPEQFATDMRLMIHNCLTYNEPTDLVTSLCQKFQSVFERRFDQITSLPQKNDQSQFSMMSRSSTKQPIKAEEVLMDSNLEDDDDIGFVREQIRITEKYLAKLREKLDRVMKKKKIKKIGTRKVQRNPTRGRSATKGIKPERRDENKEGGSCSNSRVTKEKTQSSNSLQLNVEEDDDEKYEPMGYEEKRQLSLSINKLESEQLFEMINIIKMNEPRIKYQAKGDEFELDFDALKPKTMRLLEDFVKRLMHPKRPRNPVLVRKGKVVGSKAPIASIKKELDTEQKQLEKQLLTVEDQLGMRKKTIPPPPPPPVESSSSSSSSSSGSSSSSSSSSSDSSSESE